MSKDRPCGARSFGRRLAPLLAGMALSANVQAVPPAQPNILLIIMDDVGIESLLVYNLGVDEFALTPKLDTWADTALRFDDAWTNPVCSPTRSTVLPERYGFRTGIGTLVECDAIAGLDTDDPDLLPKVLGDPQRFPQGYSPYETAAFGKWHVGSNTTAQTGCDGVDRPIDAGFDHFDGLILDQQAQRFNYFDYTRSTISESQDCVQVPNQIIEDGYQTDDMTEWVKDWITSPERDGPWFAYTAYFASHLIWHCPPQERYPGVIFNCDDSSDRSMYLAMTQAFDVDLGELLAAVDTENTLVILLGDNGSAAETVAPPVTQAKAKGTVFQGGIRVPFFIGGYTVQGGVAEEGEIVGALDLYATILAAAGVDSLSAPPPCQAGDNDGCMDSVDLSSYFVDPSPPQPPRDYLYSEFFYPNFEVGSGAGPTMAHQAIRDSRYKLMRTSDGQNAFFDLHPLVDPWETNNLLPISSNDPLAPILFDLYTEMDTLLPGGHLALCTGLQKVGETCMAHTDCCSKICNFGQATPICVNPPFPPRDPSCPIP